MVAKLSEMDPVWSNSLNNVLEKEPAVEVIRLREARESGILEGYCTARKVNTICDQVSSRRTSKKENRPVAALEVVSGLSTQSLGSVVDSR